MKLRVTSLFLLACLSSMGQIQKTESKEFVKIGEFKSGPLHASLKYFLDGKDTVYHLVYQNAEFRQITDIRSLLFLETGGTLDTLYSVLNEALNAEKEKKSTFRLGDDNIAVYTDAVMGAKFINVMRTDDHSYFTLTKRQLNKLFNRK